MISQTVFHYKFVKKLVGGGVGVALVLLVMASCGPSPVPAPAEDAIDSVAVLPFENMSNDSDWDFLSDGISEDIINALSQMSNLKVISRISSFHYRERNPDLQTAGEELGVRALVTGRVLVRGDELSIRAEMVDVQENTQLWGGEFTGKLRDILDIRQGMATEISAKLRPGLAPDETTRLTRAGTEDDQAHAAYLKGKFEENKNTPVGYRDAIQYFEDAINRDPGYARSHAALSRSYRHLVIPLYALTLEGAMPQAEDMAREAQELDDTLAEAHAALGDIQRVFHWNLEGAERAYKRAMELNPSFSEAPYGHAFVMSALGRHDEAIAANKRARQLDPLNPLTQLAATLHFIWARQYDEAIEQAQATQQMYPDLPRTYERLADAYQAKELYGEAAAAWVQWQILVGVNEKEVAGISEAAISGRDAYWRWMLSYWIEKAKRQRVPRTQGISMSYAHLGETDQALEWLEKQFEGREEGVIFLNVWPGYDPLRENPRFTDLLGRMNLAR